MDRTEQLSASFRMQYQLTRRLGAGGMGEVFEGIQSNLKRRVAIKFLSSEAFRSEENRQRFVMEARILAKLSHPSVVTVFDADVDGHTPFIAMEFVDGPTLAQRVRASGRIKTPEALTITRALVDGLVYLHDVGVLHRDLKPENVLLAGGRTPKLADFGLARASGESRLTADGFLVGTPIYMSPEQLDGGEPSAAMDIYAAGMLLYYMLAAEHAFQSPTLIELAAAKRAVTRARLAGRLASVEESVVSMIFRCLEPEAGARYPSAKALLAELDTLLARTRGARRPAAAPRARPESGRSRRASSAQLGAAAIGAALIALAAGGALHFRAPPARPATADAEAARPPTRIRLTTEILRSLHGISLTASLPSSAPLTVEIREAGKPPYLVDLPEAREHRRTLEVQDRSKPCEVTVRLVEGYGLAAAPVRSALPAADVLMNEAIASALTLKDGRFIEKLFLERAKGASPQALERRLDQFESRHRLRERLAKARLVFREALEPTVAREAGFDKLGPKRTGGEEREPELRTLAAKAGLLKQLENLFFLDQACIVIGLRYRTGVESCLPDHWASQAGEPPAGGTRFEAPISAPVLLAGRLITDFAQYALSGPDREVLEVPMELPALKKVTRAIVSARVRTVRADEMLRIHLGPKGGERLSLLLRHGSKEPSFQDLTLTHAVDPAHLTSGMNLFRLEFASPDGSMAIHIRLIGFAVTLY